MSHSMKSIAIWGLWLGAVALSLTAATPTQATEIRRVTERVFPFASGGQINVENRNGRITVEAWNKPEVRVQITRTVRAGDGDKAEAILKELKAEIEVRGDRITITSRFPKRQESIGFWEILGKVGSVQIHYYIQAPRETNLALQTSNGEVRVRGVNGVVKGTTTNGGVEVTDVHGPVEVATTNGEIHLAEVSGSARAHTTNGGVVAEVRSLEPGDEVDLHTTNGNVESYFSNELRATLEAVTTNGRVTVSFPLTTEGVMTSKSARGKINGGGNAISLSTTNGNVEVRRIGDSRSEH